jgi:hypothetical protein
LCGACRAKSVPESSALLAVLLEQPFSIRIHFSRTDTGSSTENEDTMTLRTQIETAIRTSPDSERAAIAVCRLLEDEVGLAGKGWCDDDAELRALLATAPAGTNPDHWNASVQLLEAALVERLRAARKSVSPENLGRELAGCTDAAIATLLNIEMPESEPELAVLRLLVQTRITSRAHR